MGKQYRLAEVHAARYQPGANPVPTRKSHHTGTIRALIALVLYPTSGVDRHLTKDGTTGLIGFDAGIRML
jgi:hypothetical protein